VNPRPASSEVRDIKPPRAPHAAARIPEAAPTLRNPLHDGLDDDENPYAAGTKSVRRREPALPTPPPVDSARQRAVEALGAFTRRRR
jgi:hypothetical protein